MLHLSFLVLFIHVGLSAKHIIDETPVEEGEEESYKRALRRADRNAFSNDFDTCMIHKWITNGVLKTSPTASCSSSKHSRLCYGLQSDRPADAQFISCYNTETLIPEFTAHVVPYTGIAPTGKRINFVDDRGPYAPNPQSKAVDCNKPATAVGEYFCSRGHLTPNAAFDTSDRRDLTFIMTNAAPQWQQFNAANWAAVETAVKQYVNATAHREVYVFTGTAGKVKKWAQGWLWIPWREPYKTGTGKIVVPKYFWKAVCDPVAKQSIVFIAENNVDETSNAIVTQGTCLGQPMQKQNGLVECYSMSTIQTGLKQRLWNWWHDFKFPDFDPTNCGTATIGTFLDKDLKFK